MSLFTNTSVSYLSVGIATNNGYVVSFGTYGTTNFTVQHQTAVGPRTLLACVFDANNVLQSGSPITVASLNTLIYNASLSVAGDGSFVVDWTSYASGYQIQALRYTATGALRDSSTPLQVLAAQSGSIGGTTIAEQADGSFVVAWEQLVGSNYQVWMQRFNASAVASAAVEVAAQANGGTPGLAVDGQGDFGLTWTYGSAAPNTWGRFYNAASQPESDTFPIDVGDPGYGANITRLAADANGDFTTAWESTQGGNYEILTQRLQLNQAPTNSVSIPPVNVLENAAPSTINLANYFSDVDIPYRDSLSYSVTGNTNASLVSTGISGNTLTLTYANGTSGSANLTITATDTTGLTVSAPLAVSVQWVNQAPSFTAGSNETVLSDGQADTFAGWATAMSAGPPNESGQVLSFNVTAVDSALFSVQPAIDPSGNLTFTPAPGATGSTSVVVTLHDNGGTANGGVDTSAPQAFGITITPSLVATISGASTTNVGATYTLNLSATGPGSGSLTGWTVNWGDGNTDTLDGTATSDTHVYADGAAAGPNSYSIAASATDSQGVVPAVAPVALTVYPAPVTVTAAGLGTNEAGSVYTLVLGASDLDPLTGWSVSWGDGTNSTLDGNATSATHVFASPTSTTSYTVAGTATDFNGSYVTNPVQVAVGPSSGPTTLAISGSSTAVEESPYTLNLSQSAGHAVSSWTINWGDGNTDDGRAALLPAPQYVVPPTGRARPAAFQTTPSPRREPTATARSMLRVLSQ